MKTAKQEGLIQLLKDRFEKNMIRHKGLKWAKVEENLKANSRKMVSLQLMEETGGEPDVVGFDKKSGEFIFFDCSPETPKGRRGVSYDKEGRLSRKEHRPKSSGTVSLSPDTR